MKPVLSIVFAVVTAAYTWIVPTTAEEQDVFKGKTINLLVGFGPGGENDEWARMIAVRLPRHIPGNPTVVVQNSPGAGGLNLMNTIYNTSPKDGTAIGLISRSIPMQPLFGGSGIRFDPQKMNWIGSPNREITVCVVRQDSPARSMMDLFQKELAIGAAGAGADSAVAPQFLSGLLGLRFNIIKGYSGSRDVGLAIERNEVQGTFIVYDSLQFQPLWREGKLNILFQASPRADPRLENVPLVTDLARSDEDRKVLSFFFSRVQLGRPFVAPPGLPPQRLAILRKAFEDTMNDPDLIADAEKKHLSIDLVTGKELTDIIDGIYRAPKDVVERALKALASSSR
jgi:tripartite-type tricarboxylate transporter receptor subunit TctC